MGVTGVLVLPRPTCNCPVQTTLPALDGDTIAGSFYYRLIPLSGGIWRVKRR